MKKIILAGLLLVGAATLHAGSSPFQQDTSMHKKMMQKKMSTDTSMHKTMHKSDSTMMHHKNKMMKKDSTATKQ